MYYITVWLIGAPLYHVKYWSNIQHQIIKKGAEEIQSCPLNYEANDMQLQQGKSNKPWAKHHVSRKIVKTCYRGTQQAIGGRRRGQKQFK